MKTIRLLLAALALSGIGAAYGQTLLQHYQPGPRLIDGSQLNKMVDTVNGITGAGGSAGPITATTLTANAIAAGDSSLGITGQATTQGGAIAVVGGTSSTSANAGGAITLTGGTPGATGVGGAILMAGGVGGATSGAGGAVTLAGGAGTTNAIGGSASLTAGAGQGTGNGAVSAVTGGASGAGATGAGGKATVTGGASKATDGAGGAAELTGGLGKGTGNGGAVTITGGTAGSTGTGGAVGITAGSPVAGNGSSVTLTASNGAGGTNAGGSVNFVPGTAVSTGAPGTVQINGNGGITCATFFTIGAPAAATDTVFFVATRAYLVVSVSQIHAVAAGGASVLQVTKDSTTNAPGAGTDLLTNNSSTGFDLNATANTVQTGTLTATVATKTLAAGDRLAVDFANAIQSSSGIAVTACMAPL